MFVVAWMPFDGSMCSRNPTAAHGADGSILGENFRQCVCELAAQCSNVVFSAHGLPPTLTWNGPAMWLIAISAMSSNGGTASSRVPIPALGLFAEPKSKDYCPRMASGWTELYW